MPHPPRAPLVMNGPQSDLLIVEGADDFHALFALLDAHRLVEKFRMTVGGGHNQMREEMDTRLLESGLERIGFVFDADTEIADRWRAVRDRLRDEQCGYTNVPAAPEPGGTIITRAGKVTVGLWLMPNNALPGALEEFVRLLVPAGDALWQHAETVVAALPEKRDAVTDNWTSKARIHTWLAWQNEPGKPIGQAITKRYLNPQAEEARPLLAWLRTLFHLDAAAS